MRTSFVATRSALLLIAFGLAVSEAHAGQTASESETERLVRGRIEMLREGLEARAEGDRLLAAVGLPAFYDARAFAPAWLSPGLPRVAALRRAIASAYAHGLEPSDYHLSELDGLAAVVRSGRAPAADSADLELLASDAFMLLGSHLLQGRVDPETVNPDWLANRRDAALHEVLARAMQRGAIEAELGALAPQQPRYRTMLDALARLRETEARGGWTPVPGGARLEVDSAGPRVEALRLRLVQGGDLPARVTPPRSDGSSEGSRSGPDVFDEALADAVRSFQSRHGLDADGVVGPATLAALNVPVGTRVRQLETNLERWRWLPADLGRRHVEVNIAGFEVRVVEDGRTVRTHRAVVGRQYRQTPMFSGSMTYLVLSPYWHVPPTIAAVDKLPVIQRDPGAIAAQRMTLLDQRTNETVDPAGVDWASLTGPEFNRRYRLRQDPGPTNALGSVKFMFPNRHNVYLHDTPSRELFSRAVRSFSSGCIRVENPLDLAEYLLGAEPGWNRSRIEAAAAAGTERVVRLSTAVPVHLLYWTAWADADGTLHFREDIYGRDPAVHGALEAPPPGMRP